MTAFDVLLQQLIIGLSNGMIIALIALGYTMVYGIIELINFAHGDLFMLGCFCALTLVGLIGAPDAAPGSPAALLAIGAMFLVVPAFCGGMNWLVDRLAYRHLRQASRLAPLVSAIGVSFVFLNLGLFWGGLPMDVFGQGKAAAARKSFPGLISNTNLFGDAAVQVSANDVTVLVVTVALMAALSWFITRTRTGTAMRAIAQDRVAARLMGIDVDRIIGRTFLLGGALAGVASVVYALYNNTIYFQMGYRVGIDAFTAAVLGGIGRMPGAVLGGIVIGIVRALSDQYIAAEWTNAIVFVIMIVVLVFRPSGILGSAGAQKV